MYLRTVKAKGAEGVEFEYIRLVEAYWRAAVPNSASSLNWDARICLRRILRVSLSF